MPTISMFFGINIRIYFAPKEHQPPHFHAYYAEHKATVDIRTCEILRPVRLENPPPSAVSAAIGRELEFNLPFLKPGSGLLISF